MEIEEESGKVYTVTQRTEEKRKCCKCSIITITIIVIILIVPFGFAISQIAVGSLYNDKCSISSKIPIFLIVAGIVQLIQLLFIICRILGKCTTVLPFIYLVGFFNLAWMVMGGLWTFEIRSTYQSIDSSLTDTYCHRIVYRTALATIFLTIFSLICGLFNRNQAST